MLQKLLITKSIYKNKGKADLTTQAKLNLTWFLGSREKSVPNRTIHLFKETNRTKRFKIIKRQCSWNFCIFCIVKKYFG